MKYFLTVAMVLGLSLVAGCGAQRYSGNLPPGKPAEGSLPASAAMPVNAGEAPSTCKFVGLPPTACSADGSCLVPAAQEPKTCGALHLKEGDCGGPNPAPVATTTAVTAAPAAPAELGDGCCSAPVTAKAEAAPAKTVNLQQLDGPLPAKSSCCGGGLIEAAPAAAAGTAKAVPAVEPVVQKQANPNVDVAPAADCPTCDGH